MLLSGASVNSVVVKLLSPVLFFPFAVQPNEVRAQSPLPIPQVRPLTTPVLQHKITKVITNPPDRPDVYTYYKVDTKGDLHVAYHKDGSFSLVYKNEDTGKNLFFPQAPKGQLVAMICGSNIGYPGAFEIYSKGNDNYSVTYNINVKSTIPLLNIPSHTWVHSAYAKNMISAIESLPEPFTKELAKQGITVMIAKDYNDAYYYYYPSWKESDRWKVEDPQKPPYELTPKGYVDHRKYSSIGGLFVEGKAIIPQIVTQYGSTKTVDRAESKDYIIRVLYHELGHALDYAYSSAFSDLDSFKGAHAADIKGFSEEDKTNLVYFYNSRSETFAHLTAALLGGLSKEESAVMLSKFKSSAEIVRQDVLPRIGVDISIENIRKNIYPDYNRKVEPVKTSQVIAIPDIPRDLIPQLAFDRSSENNPLNAPALI